ncbi:MAG: hypothetical protein Q9214_003745 [Letrouitia sp. 1 TL-2023]
MPTPEQFQFYQDFNVAQWREDVANTVRTRKPPDRLSDLGSGSKRHLTHSSRSTRTNLTQIPGNAQKYELRKRKRSMDATDQGQGGRGRGRGRGRPPKNPGQHFLGTTQRIPIRDASAVSGSGSGSGSGSKRGSRGRASSRKRTLDQEKSTASIDFKYLASCDPPVERETLEALIREKMPLSKETMNLYWKLKKIPHALIPIDLKDEYKKATITPRKTKNPPEIEDYLLSHKTPYPREFLTSLKRRVDRVLMDAKWNEDDVAHERQWGSLVNQLLNTERNTEKNTDDTEDTASGKNVSKMVDWCLALIPEREDKHTINKAFAAVRPNGCSLNQSLSYISRYPLFLDIEIKKTQFNHEPEVQLAIWASGALQKRRLHRWDTSMPMPGIIVTGHTWSYYLFVPMGKGLAMLGQFPMGSTDDLMGVWQIIYRLNILIQWGTNEYKEWFDKNVINWARKLAGASIQEEEALGL